MSDFEFFSKDPSWWGETFASIWGDLDICPLLNQFHLASITYPELYSLISLRAWGDVEKFHSDIAYLLVSTKDEATSDRVYSLSTIWVNPCQARVSTVEEAVRQLTGLVSSGPKWPYDLVWFNRDTCHAPLPREGHLSVQPEGGTSSATCRMSQPARGLTDSWAQVSQVIYPVGLNGCEAPMIALHLPKSLARGTNLLGGKPIYLKGGHPAIHGSEGVTTERCHPLAFAPPCWWPASSRLLCQRQKERSAWPWQWGSSCPRQY